MLTGHPEVRKIVQSRYSEHFGLAFIQEGYIRQVGQSPMVSGECCSACSVGPDSPH